ncbi:carboxymethylenebutenolidase [Sphingomonas piscis]|uniref:Carboxymethylenebutenolidase n=1 Tax=Sphingomonas piscis TaxID=2714943 RepID=A0A6G7YNV7_9SPHN|nr:dienelactone hydrolase family protein [Sphingomonas piscis]QIK78421.1 carboxymethylenebutenolidase [Sphingomonas piscis]
MSAESAVEQKFEDQLFEHVLVPRRDRQKRPGVILFPTVMGVSDLEIGFGRELVHLGYTALVADVFGKSFRGAPREVMAEEMNRLRGDRAVLRRIVVAVLEQARTLPEIDGTRIAVAGYCFGGMCALDLARSGADIAGAASFHGLFDPPGMAPQPISAKVIAFHGWDDPLVTPDKVVALGHELTEAGADWQIHAYGHTGHAFTNPKATGAMPGIQHQPVSADRAWTAFVNFLEELWGDA